MSVASTCNHADVSLFHSVIDEFLDVHVKYFLSIRVFGPTQVTKYQDYERIEESVHANKSETISKMQPR